MSSFRLSKKNTHKDPRTTIHAIHDEQMNKFEYQEKTLPDKENELIKLKEKLNKTTTPIKNYERVLILDRIRELEDEIYNIKNKTEMIDYLFKAAKFFEDDKNDNENEYLKNNKITNGKKYNKFLNICFNKPCEELEYVNDYNYSCTNCGCGEKEIDNRNNYVICTNCGATEYNFGSDIEWTLYETHEPVQVFNYKRKNHFKEWLMQLQAKENTNIPDELINKIYLELKKERITDVDKITYEKIKGYMSKHNFNKYFEHIPFIFKKITNKQPIELDDILERKLFEMFDEIQAPFEKHKHMLSNRTKNFLSYSFTLYKFCQLLGRNDLLKFFPLLKDREKIFEQEVVWRHICKDLHWEYIRG